jgi:DNA-binding transcriptional MerR regulator
MLQQLYSTIETARLVGVTEFRLAYAHRTGQLAEPTYKIANKRIYTQDDLQRVAEYFKNRQPWDRRRDGT